MQGGRGEAAACRPGGTSSPDTPDGTLILDCELPKPWREFVLFMPPTLWRPSRLMQSPASNHPALLLNVRAQRHTQPPDIDSLGGRAENLHFEQAPDSAHCSVLSTPESS